MRREDQERVLTEVQSRVLAEKIAQANSTGGALDEVIADSIYYERLRLKDESDGRERKEALAFWSRVQRRMNRGGDRSHRALVGEIVSRYASEICGNFDERVYRVATQILPSALGLLVNAVSPKRLLSRFPALPGLEDSVVIQGETEHIRRLHELGTVILVPQHVSNLDSLVMGFAVYQLGLPPLIYGAGLNLFSNPLMSFFMRNLGAYTVDRRKKDRLYKDVLKQYATLTLELGYDNLFFPGGTRSRSGAIERYLKMGLLGSGVTAYVNNLMRGKRLPNIYIVPATLSFQLVLEAETLIDDFIKEVGKSRYIITDDEFSKPKRVFDFMSQLMSLDSKAYVTFGRGIDPFGNLVDDDGVSLDPRGRSIDIERYTFVRGEPGHDAQREREYTAEVGERIKEAFTQDNLVQSTNVVAHSVFNMLRSANRNYDLMRLLRLGGEDDDFELRQVYRETHHLLDELRAMAAAGKIRLSEDVLTGDAEDVVSDALRHFAIYHADSAIYRQGDRLFIGNRGLLFYYQNRLEGYNLGSRVNLEPALTASHQRLMDM